MTGWGRNGVGRSLPLEDILLKGSLKIISNQVCEERWLINDKQPKDKPFGKSVLCADGRWDAAPNGELRCNGVDSNCCTKETPCNEGDGDCDTDDDCLGSLYCKKDGCVGDGFDKTDDCCAANDPDACKGDSGSPLVTIEKGSQRWTYNGNEKTWSDLRRTLVRLLFLYLWQQFV